jgi:hypothetical protein
VLHHQHCLYLRNVCQPVHDLRTVSVLDMQHITLNKITMDRDHVVTAVWDGYRNDMPAAYLEGHIPRPCVTRRGCRSAAHGLADFPQSCAGAVIRQSHPHGSEKYSENEY